MQKKELIEKIKRGEEKIQEIEKLKQEKFEQMRMKAEEKEREI